MNSKRLFKYCNCLLRVRAYKYIPELYSRVFLFLVKLVINVEKFIGMLLFMSFIFTKKNITMAHTV